MKNFLILSLICISTINCLDAVRDLIMAYYNGYKGTSIVLDEKCFGSNFDKDFELIKQYVSERNIPELISILLSLGDELWDACLADELVAIFDRFEKKIKDQTILNDIFAKVLKIGLEIYRAIKIGAISFSNLGDLLGRISFTLLSDKTPE